MPYTIESAIRDEIAFLKELQKIEEKDDSPILAAIFREQANSLRRVINRLEAGIDYSLTVKDDEIIIKPTKTDRKKLEDDYPALKKAAEEYNIVKNLVKNS
jgi:hypothetical protein